MQLIKKEGERFYLESFLKVVKWDTSILRPGDDLGSEPDFFISLSGKEVGIELTQLFKRKNKNGSPEKQNERFHQKFFLKLAAEYYKLTNIPIQLQILSDVDLNHDKTQEIAQFLKNIASTLQTNTPFEGELDTQVKIFLRRLPETETFVRYSRGWTWVSDHGGFSKSITDQMIEEVLNPKLQKLDKYKSKIDQVILLIYSDRSMRSGLVHLNSLIDLKETGFDSAFLYIHPMKQVIELKRKENNVSP